MTSRCSWGNQRKVVAFILVAPKSKHGSHDIQTLLLSISVTSEGRSMKFGETKGVVLQGKEVK